ncbi:MAG: tRNA (adenosine(37)-N6)-threonylcarbamoyltransferase complex dimerization subunit type 1 TsaB [Gammaproteobacteria bacterium]|nr:MAG: tRNA (adenosine(37)-N6)-threonylcarbamoyltransferase complex dimerization subunit type 1 TsaB [Gammaproteobacteria bacterium]
MNILAIDSSTEVLSLALQAAKNITSINLCHKSSPHLHGDLILSEIENLLKKNNLSMIDLDLLVYGRGPGSFTGVRMASAVIQGLSCAIDAPIVGISSLETMAYQVIKTNHNKNCNHIISTIDARMKQVYWAEYIVENNTIKIVGSERVDNPDKIIPQIKATDNSFIIGNALNDYAKILQQQLKIKPQNCYKNILPDVIYMLPIAEKLFKNNKTIPSHLAIPSYVRNNVACKKKSKNHKINKNF